MNTLKQQYRMDAQEKWTCISYSLLSDLIIFIFSNIHKGYFSYVCTRHIYSISGNQYFDLSFLNDEWKKSNSPYQEHYLDPLHVLQTDIITSHFISMTIMSCIYLVMLCHTNFAGSQ